MGIDFSLMRTDSFHISSVIQLPKIVSMNSHSICEDIYSTLSFSSNLVLRSVD